MSLIPGNDVSVAPLETLVVLAVVSVALEVASVTVVLANVEDSVNEVKFCKAILLGMTCASGN